MTADPDLRTLRNLNTREDYEQARFVRENEHRVNAGIRARTLEAQLKPSIEITVVVGTALVKTAHESGVKAAADFVRSLRAVL